MGVLGKVRAEYKCKNLTDRIDIAHRHCSDNFSTQIIKMTASSVNTPSITPKPEKFPLNLLTCFISQNVDDDIMGSSSKLILEQVSSNSDGPDIRRFLQQDKTVECQQCYAIFKDKKKLKQHRKIALYCHAFSNEINVECPQCLNIFSNNKELNNHRKIGYYCECLSTDVNYNTINY